MLLLGYDVRRGAPVRNRPNCSGFPCFIHIWVSWAGHAAIHFYSFSRGGSFVAGKKFSNRHVTSGVFGLNKTIPVAVVKRIRARSKHVRGQPSSRRSQSGKFASSGQEFTPKQRIISCFTSMFPSLWILLFGVWILRDKRTFGAVRFWLAEQSSWSTRTCIDRNGKCRRVLTSGGSGKSNGTFARSPEYVTCFSTWLLDWMRISKSITGLTDWIGVKQDLLRGTLDHGFIGLKHPGPIPHHNRQRFWIHRGLRNPRGEWSFLTLGRSGSGREQGWAIWLLNFFSRYAPFTFALTGAISFRVFCQTFEGETVFTLGDTWSWFDVGVKATLKWRVVVFASAPKTTARCPMWKPLDVQPKFTPLKSLQGLGTRWGHCWTPPQSWTHQSRKYFVVYNVFLFHLW